MRLEQLTCLLALGQYETMTMAAKALDMSPSALSRAIANLEQELGFVVYARGNSACGLTQKGYQAADLAMAILDGIGRLGGEPKDNLELRGSVAIAAPAFLAASNTMARTIAAFYKAYPQADLVVKEVSLEECAASVLRDECAFAVCAWPASQDVGWRQWLGSVGLCLAYDSAVKRLCAYLSPEHPLAGEKQITYAQLQQYGLVSYQGMASSLLAMIFGSKPDIALLTVDDQETEKRIVSASQMLTLRFDDPAEYYLRMGLLTSVPLVGDPGQYRFGGGVVYRKGAPLSYLAGKFRDILRLALGAAEHAKEGV